MNHWWYKSYRVLCVSNQDDSVVPEADTTPDPRGSMLTPLVHVRKIQLTCADLRLIILLAFCGNRIWGKGFWQFPTKGEPRGHCCLLWRACRSSEKSKQFFLERSDCLHLSYYEVSKQPLNIELMRLKKYGTCSWAVLDWDPDSSESQVIALSSLSPPNPNSSL